MSFEPRESIHPRAFAMRHMLLEELKHRRRTTGASSALDDLARALDVVYDAAGPSFIVTAGAATHTIPADAVAMYATRRDTEGSMAEWQREDPALAANRRLAAATVDVLLAAQRGAATPSGERSSP